MEDDIATERKKERTRERERAREVRIRKGRK
jgi:hypothetical protein